MKLPDYADLVDLAAERLGGAVLLANDEFFAPKESLLKAAAPVWREDAYTDRGKWMDGWETRRRRTPGHDWCLVRLGLPGVVRGVVVDTSFFRGNYPEACALEGLEVDGVPDPESLAADAATRWHDLVPRTPLAGDSRNAFGWRSSDASPTSRSASSPTAAWRDCASTGRRAPRWSGSRAAACWTWPPWRTADSSSSAATCS